MNRMWKALRLALVAIAATVAIAYLGVLGYLYFNQRQMLFEAKPGHETPDIHDLAIQDIAIPTPDGQTLQAWYEPPKPGKPVILYFHGQGATLALGKWRYIRMHKEGVGYLALAYRGFSGSTGHPTEQGVLVDGLAAYDWLKDHGFRDQDIVIHGHSLGTGVATYVATKRPARALILEAPFTAASDVASERYPFVPVSLLMHDKFESRARIKDVHMPLLIIHGTRDSVIPFADGKRLFDMANLPKVFVAMPNSEHNTLTRDGAYVHYWRFLGLEPEDFDPALVVSSPPAPAPGSGRSR